MHLRVTLWVFEVTAEESGRVLVDATTFTRDVHHVTNMLQQSQQGTYRLDPHVAPSLYQTPKTFRKTPRSKPVDIYRRPEWSVYSASCPGA